MIRIVYTGAGVIIGEMIKSVSDDVITLKNPRLLVVEQPDEKNPGRIGFFIYPLFGKPNVYEASRANLNHDVNDETVIHKYKEVVSGLALPKSSLSLVQ